MQKLLVLPIAVCVGLVGCQSPTWNAVVGVRPGNAYLQTDPSAYYAGKLHAVLLEQGIEHYVVTYQYHYYSNHYEEAVAKRTAVVYRDNANAQHPWWLMDDRRATPFWLPQGDLDQQLSFYCGRKAVVIEKRHYPARGEGGKVVLPAKRSAQQVQFRGSVAQRPPLPQPRVHVAERTQATQEARLEMLFYSRNGTVYDPMSPIDRRKMEQLRHGLVGMETDGERAFRHGVDGSRNSEPF